jgi:hypothetical protein
MSLLTCIDEGILHHGKDWYAVKTTSQRRDLLADSFSVLEFVAQRVLSLPLSGARRKLRSLVRITTPRLLEKITSW